MQGAYARDGNSGLFTDGLRRYEQQSTLRTAVRPRRVTCGALYCVGTLGWMLSQWPLGGRQDSSSSNFNGRALSRRTSNSRTLTPAMTPRARQRSCVRRSSARGNCLRLKPRTRSSETAVVAAANRLTDAAGHSTSLHPHSAWLLCTRSTQLSVAESNHPGRSLLGPSDLVEHFTAECVLAAEPACGVTPGR